MDLACPGCGCEYNQVEREPQNLSCGCDLCLICVEERRGGRCADGHEVEWARVTTSRRVLRMVQAAAHSCPAHRGRPYDFWCPTCRAPLCGICAVAHKDQCMRPSGAGFYLVEMTHATAGEDLLRVAAEHVKAIEHSCTDLAASVPAALLRSPEQVAEFLQAKALEAIAAFYANLERTMAEVAERCARERAAVTAEVAKRDSAIAQLGDARAAIEQAVMELNVAMRAAREAKEAQGASELSSRRGADATAAMSPPATGRRASADAATSPAAGQPQPPATAALLARASPQQQLATATAEAGAKASQLASAIQKLNAERASGALKGAVACHHARYLADLKVVALETLHPTWAPAEPPARSCELYRGIQRRPAGSDASGGLDAAYAAVPITLGRSGGAGSAASASTAAAAAASSRLRGGAPGATSALGAAGPRTADGGVYEQRNLSPSPSRRPRLMESLWRESM